MHSTKVDTGILYAQVDSSDFRDIWIDYFEANEDVFTHSGSELFPNRPGKFNMLAWFYFNQRVVTIKGYNFLQTIAEGKIHDFLNFIATLAGQGLCGLNQTKNTGFMLWLFI